MSKGNRIQKDLDKKIRVFEEYRRAKYNEIEREYRRKQQKNLIEQGPRVKFENYYKTYIETKLNGKEPTALQTVEIVKQFLNDEENSKLKEIYTVEDIMNWAPTKERDDDGR